jgi:hypothetical protein
MGGVLPGVGVFPSNHHHHDPCVTILPIAKPAMGDVERRALGRIYFEAGESNVLWSRLHTISNRVSSEMFIVAKKKVVYKALEDSPSVSFLRRGFLLMRKSVARLMSACLGNQLRRHFFPPLHSLFRGPILALGKRPARVSDSRDRKSLL